MYICFEQIHTTMIRKKRKKEASVIKMPPVKLPKSVPFGKPTKESIKSKFRPDMIQRAYRLSLLGLTNEELAIAFGVSTQRLEGWMRNKAQFARAIDLGRMEADSKVAASMYKAACGYKYKEDHVAVSHGQVHVTQVEKTALPNMTAAIFWLKNRQPTKWADVWKMEHSGEVTHKQADYDLTDLSEDELRVLEKVGLPNLNLEN